MAKPPRAAKDEKKGGARAKFLEEAKARKPRPAKDVKPGSLREQSTKRPDKSGVSGTSTEARRIADAKKSRGPFGQLTTRKDTPPAKVEEPKRGIVKYEEPKRGVVKYEGPKPSAGVAAGNVLRSALRGVGSRAALTAGFFLDPKTFSAKTGGQANYGEQDWINDKANRGPLMKGGEQPGYKYLEDKKAMPAKVLAPERGGGPEKRQGSSAPSMARPAAPKKAEQKAAPKKEAKKAPEKKTFAKKAEAPAKPTFRGNWVGAAPTAMQARLGRKVSGRRTFGRDR